MNTDRFHVFLGSLINAINDCLLRVSMVHEGITPPCTCSPGCIRLFHATHACINNSANHQRQNAVGVMAMGEENAGQRNRNYFDKETHWVCLNTKSDMASTSSCLRILKQGIPKCLATFTA